MDGLSPGIGLFGGRLRTTVLLALRLLEQTWPSQLAVQRVLASLEAEGVIASRLVGRTRL